MKIAELSSQSGVPIGTIKFYIREGLLQRGKRSATNQASYGVRHLERLRLIQALTEIAALSIDDSRKIIEALGAPRPKAGTVFRMAFDSLGNKGRGRTGADETRELLELKAAIATYLRRMGWSVDESHSALTDLAKAWRSACGLWHPRWLQPAPSLDALRPFAEAMKHLAEVEMPDEAWNPDEDASGTLTAAIVGTVLFEPILLAMRRLAHENRARELTRERAKAPIVGITANQTK